MSSLTSRSVVLILARMTNYAVLLLSPIVLVRILDVESYGQYREFTLYAFLAASILAFGSKSNLLFFIPREPDKEHIYVFNTILFLFMTTTAGLLLVFFAQGVLTKYISFDFINLLIIYVLLYVNLDLMESFWLAKKRSDYVFIYSATLLAIRMAAVVLTALYTRDVLKVVYSMILVEAVKFALLALWWLKVCRISWKFDKEAAVQQLKFTLPLGIGGLISILNQKFGGVFIATSLGTTALAIYSVGIYQVPVLAIVRSAVSDVIFPDMVQHNEGNRDAALLLWQRANVVFCVVVFPVFSVFFVNAEPFITLLFTEQYSSATPVFQLILILMVRRCFELGTPLRSRNMNQYFYRGNLIALVTNVIITFALYDDLGLIAPAAAFVISDILMAGYLANKVLKVYSLRLSMLFMWGKIGRIVVASVMGIPVLIIVGYYGSSLSQLGAVLVYCLIYYVLIRYYRLDEVEAVMQKINKRIGWAI